MISRRKLTEPEITAMLASAPGWSYGSERLRTEFATGNFNNGVTLINQIAKIADKLNHHPDIFLTYRKVVVETYTHDAGGITEFDFELAKQITALGE